MTLKQATMAAAICCGIGLAWTCLSLVLPQSVLLPLYKTRVPAAVFFVRDAAVLNFFFVLLRNQR
jgi:hypothetical protein